jgi:DNA repair protein RadC
MAFAYQTVYYMPKDLCWYCTREQDKLLTRALVMAAETIQLKIIDHLIISPDKAFSFKKAGLL